MYNNTIMTQWYNGAVLATEQPEQICIHIWRDKTEIEWTIEQECVRCKKSRKLLSK